MSSYSFGSQEGAAIVWELFQSVANFEKGHRHPILCKNSEEFSRVRWGCSIVERKVNFPSKIRSPEVCCCEGTTNEQEKIEEDSFIGHNEAVYEKKL